MRNTNKLEKVDKMKIKKLLSGFLTLMMLLSLVSGLPIKAMADGTPTITTTSTLQNGATDQQIVITLANDTFIGGALPTINDTNNCISGSISTTIDSSTQMTIGLIGGTFTEGTVSFYIPGYGLTSGTDSNTITLTIPAASGALALPSETLREAKNGASYSHTFTTTGGDGVKTLAVTSGTLPDGLSFNDNGTQTVDGIIQNSATLDGTPTTDGTYHFTITATDSSSPTPQTVSTPYSLTVGTPTNVDGYSFLDGVIYGYTGAGGAVSIPSKLGGVPVTAIGESAFYENDNITSIIIPNSVTTIGGWAF